MNDTNLAVGSTIWQFDENRRIYPPGRAWNSGPIYREHWRPVEITGENRRSWITSRGKCPKSGPHRGWALSVAEVDDDCWMNQHRYEIVRLLERSGDVTLMRNVARILGYHPDGE